MAFFEDAFLKAKQVAHQAGKKAGETLEFSKLRIAAAETEKKIDGEFCELGKMVYKAAKEQSDCTEYVEEKVKAVDQLKAELGETNAKIDELRRLKKCPQCGFTNAAQAEYCIKCGQKL